MKFWLSLLSLAGASGDEPPAELAKLFREGWTDPESAMRAAPAGSMEMSLPHLAMERVSRF